MIGGNKFRGRKLNKSKKVFSNNVNNANNANNAPVIKPGTYVRPTFNTGNNRNNRPKSRKVRSNKGKKRTPYGPRTGVTRSKKIFRS